MLDSLVNFRYFSDTLDILIVAIIIYYIARIIEGTRASQIMIGFFIVLSLYFVSQRWGLLFTLNWLLGHFLESIILIIVILFQNDIRKALARIGKRPLAFSFTKHESNERVVEELVKASSYLSSQKIGALIAIERSINLDDFAEIGVDLDADVSRELIISIFNHQSPLHDGAIIIRNNKILSAGSFCPIETDPDLERDLGTRHRAAMGLSSDTDAVVIVISEESGFISLSLQGEISRNIDATTLHNNLLFHLGIKKSKNIEDSILLINN